MLRRSRARSSGWTSSSHSRSDFGIAAASMPKSPGKVSEQLSISPPAATTRWPSWAITWARTRLSSRWRSMASRRRRSVMSRAVFETPITVPLASRIGEMLSETGTSRPSLCRRQVSRFSTRSPRATALITSSSSRDWSSGMSTRSGAADDLVGAVAEQPLGARIPAEYRAVEVLADDRVGRALHDRVEHLQGAQAFALFGAPGADQAQRLPIAHAKDREPGRGQGQQAEAEGERGRRHRFGANLRRVDLGHQIPVAVGDGRDDAEHGPAFEIEADGGAAHRQRAPDRLRGQDVGAERARVATEGADDAAVGNPDHERLAAARRHRPLGERGKQEDARVDAKGQGAGRWRIGSAQGHDHIDPRRRRGPRVAIDFAARRPARLDGAPGRGAQLRQVARIGVFFAGDDRARSVEHQHAVVAARLAHGHGTLDQAREARRVACAPGSCSCSPAFGCRTRTTPRRFAPAASARSGSNAAWRWLRPAPPRSAGLADIRA